MSSLFLKIFLWFWLAMAAIVVAVALVSVASQPEPLNPPQHALIASALRTEAERAVAIYEQRGAANLKTHLQRAQRRSGAELYLFDDSGSEVLSQNTPDSIRQIRARLLQAARKTLIELDGTDVVAAQVATGQRGRYVLVGVQSQALLRAASFGAGAISPRMRLVRLVTILLMAGLVCYGLARYIAAPAAALRRATHCLAAGDLSTRVAPKLGRRRDELADLARDFDVMAARIETLVTSQRRLLSNISHELRSPLARLQVALSLGERHLENNEREKARENLQRIAREAERLDALIAELLVLARLESGVAPLQKAPLDLAQIAREVVTDADFEASAQGKRVLLSRCDACRMEGDANLLRRALENVVRNALRHSPKNAAVVIELCHEGRAGALTVCDEGAGVSPTALAKLFEPFFRVDDARAPESGGAGLGLSIVKHAIEAHDGQVLARNRESGGLCVKISLPLIGA